MASISQPMSITRAKHLMRTVSRRQGLLTPERQIAYYLVRRKEGQMQAYCMKCRAKKEIKNPKSIVMKNKRPATQGVCPTCGTKVFRIGK